MNASETRNRRASAAPGGDAHRVPEHDAHCGGRELSQKCAGSFPPPVEREVREHCREEDVGSAATGGSSISARAAPRARRRYGSRSNACMKSGSSASSRKRRPSGRRRSDGSRRRRQPRSPPRSPPLVVQERRQRHILVTQLPVQRHGAQGIPFWDQSADRSPSACVSLGDTSSGSIGGRSTSWPRPIGDMPERGCGRCSGIPSRTSRRTRTRISAAQALLARVAGERSGTLVSTGVQRGYRSCETVLTPKLP